MAKLCALNFFIATAGQRLLGRLNVRASLTAVFFAFAAFARSTNTSQADEGGVGFWFPGLFGSLAAAPQVPGWAIAILDLYNPVSAGGNVAAARQITIGNLPINVKVNLNATLKAEPNLVLVDPTYVFATPVFGGQFAVSMAGAYGRGIAGISGTLTESVGGITITKQGRFRYYRIASPLVARMLESIKAVAAIELPPRHQPRSARDEALRFGRTCYDHLAGTVGVAIADALAAKGYVVLGDDGGEVTDAGACFLADFGAALSPQSRSRRIFCRPCLDWSERRYHIAGHVGAEICRCCLARGWFAHERDSRALRLTPAGRAGLRDAFGVEFPAATPKPQPYPDRAPARDRAASAPRAP